MFLTFKNGRNANFFQALLKYEQITFTALRTSVAFFIFQSSFNHLNVNMKYMHVILYKSWVLGLHLQALIYPLTVASKSTTTARHNAANKILKNMCEHCNTLVQQAIMVRSCKHTKASKKTQSESTVLCLVDCLTERHLLSISYKALPL